jgi:hypothetical protein
MMTARDSDGIYPAPGANVYPIIFTTEAYDPALRTDRSAVARALAMNLAPCPGCYLPEGTVVRVWRIGHRYYTYHRVPATGCTYEEDQWDRDDSDDPGEIWTETAGDWDVLDETLVTSDADAELTCSTSPGRN